MTSQSQGAELSRVGGYREFAPPADLAEALEGLWVHSPPTEIDNQSARICEPPAHRVIPHFGACLTLKRVFSPRGELEDIELLFLGPVSRPRFFPVEAGQEMISLRLRPELCQAILDVDVRNLWNEIEDYGALAPALARQLLNGLEAPQTIDEVFALLCSWLVRRIGEIPTHGSASFEISRAVIEHLRRRDGDARVNSLVRDLGRSPQYMRRFFRDRLGATPKRIACLLRLNAAISHADTKDCPAWADIAARFGYSDQAHLVHEVKRWTGASPTTLHAERRAELEPYLCRDLERVRQADDGVARLLQFSPQAENERRIDR